MKKSRLLATIVLCLASSVHALSITPPYLTWDFTWFNLEAQETRVTVNNRSHDVSLIQMSVLDKQENHMPFASHDRELTLAPGKSREVIIYVRKVDIPRAYYICAAHETTFSATSSGSSQFYVQTRVCSKFAAHLKKEAPERYKELQHMGFFEPDVQ